MTKEQFALNIEQIRKQLYKTAFLYFGNETTAMDVVDEAVYKALCNYHKIRQEEYFDTWITRILLNLSLIHYPNMEIEDRETDSNIFDIENVIEEFEFILTFDPTFTDTGKQIPVNKTILLDGQKINVTNIEIYPSHIRIHIEDDPTNTAWLTGLDYQILIDDSKAFDPIMGGISATGSEDSPAMVSFRTDSSYFYDADHIILKITGATWLEKEKEKAYINLETGVAHNLPENVTLQSIDENEGSTWVSIQVPFLKENHYHQVFLQSFCDKKGREYTSSHFGTDGALEEKNYFIQSMELTDYQEKEVWISLKYSHIWEAKMPIELKIEVNE